MDFGMEMPNGANHGGNSRYGFKNERREFSF